MYGQFFSRYYYMAIYPGALFTEAMHFLVYPYMIDHIHMHASY